ncbi:DUF4126 domain-containing protein [Microbacterium rhizophilus]|uniref:DUF4126 domain-containing protein n=1 Tax=Microbacterium rhizophilus TaxID=3138934 RepID=UPI0031EDA06B
MDPAWTAALLSIASGTVSGLRPYFVVLTLGAVKALVPLDAAGPAAGVIGAIPEMLAQPWVLIVVGVLALGEVVVDKIPYLDSAWDGIHLVLRPLFGAALGYGIGADEGTGVAVGAAVAGGVTAAGVSFGKAATRAVVNTLPEPVSNVLVSFGEDAAAAVLLVLAFPLLPLAAILAVLLLIGAVALFVWLRRRRLEHRRRRRDQGRPAPA